MLIMGFTCSARQSYDSSLCPFVKMPLFFSHPKLKRKTFLFAAAFY